MHIRMSGNCRLSRGGGECVGLSTSNMLTVVTYNERLWDIRRSHCCWKKIKHKWTLIIVAVLCHSYWGQNLFISDVIKTVKDLLDWQYALPRLNLPVCDSVDPTRLLLTFNVSVNLGDKYHKNTALHWAVLAGNTTVISLLLDANANVDAQNIKVAAFPWFQWPGGLFAYRRQ